MKRVLVAIFFSILGIVSALAQEKDTTEVTRITRRINDFDLYKVAAEKKEEIKEAGAIAVEEKEEEEVVPKQEEPKREILASLESSLNDGTYYSVQVAACREPLSESYLEYQDYKEVYGIDGWYRYFSKRFLTLSETKDYQREVRNTTKFKDAFPVRIKGVEKVNLSTGLPLCYRKI